MVIQVVMQDADEIARPSDQSQGVCRPPETPAGPLL